MKEQIAKIGSSELILYDDSKDKKEFEICPICDCKEFDHIRGKVHCRNCHVILRTCCE